VSNGTTTHDLMIHAEQRDGGVLLGVSFRDELFERSSIERFITSLCTLLAQAVAAPGLPTQKLPIITSGAPLFVMSPASGSRELA
jgi:non-ribosomal peptide synthetase component F